MENKKIWINNLDKSSYDIERNIKIPKELDKDLAYFCGVLMGDGHIANGLESDYDLSCAGNPKDEKEFYDKIIRGIFNKLFNIKIKTKLQKYSGTYGFRIGSKLIHGFLTNSLGMPKGKKYDQIKIPSLIKQNELLKKHFIIGLFDTDFGFTLKKRYKKINYYPVMCFASKSYDFTKEIYDDLKSYGFILTNLYKVKDIDERAKDGYTVVYRFDMNGHINLIKWFKIFGTRHSKNIKKFKRWLKINKNNIRLTNKVNRMLVAGDPRIDFTSNSLDLNSSVIF